MPCKLCDQIYDGKPCNKGRVKFKDTSIANINKIYLENMFETLSEACPCVECLVRVVCLKNRLECESYLTLLTLVNKKGYISKKMRRIKSASFLRMRI